MNAIKARPRSIMIVLICAGLLLSFVGIGSLISLNLGWATSQLELPLVITASALVVAGASALMVASRVHSIRMQAALVAKINRTEVRQQKRNALQDEAIARCLEVLHKIESKSSDDESLEALNWLRVNVATKEGLTAIDESLAESQEALAVSQDGLRAVLYETREISAAQSRKTLNVIRGQAKVSNAAFHSTTEGLDGLKQALEAVEQGQRRVLNFLRKEGNVEYVLSRLAASERRLVASFERSSLSSLDQIVEILDDHGVKSTERLVGLEVACQSLSSELVGLQKYVEQFSAPISRVVSSTEDLWGKTSDIEELLRAMGKQALTKESIESLVVDALSPINETLRHSSETTGLAIERQDSQLDAVYARIDTSATEVVRQVEAVLQLLRRVEIPQYGLPSSGGWGMNPDSLLLLSDLVREHRPKVIVELGSGSSTIWLGLFAKAIGARLVSLEHIERYYRETTSLVKDFELEEVVDVRFAKLGPVVIDGDERQWYDLGSLEDIDSIDMLIVDGPPKSTGPEPRFPAVPVLSDRLASGAIVVVDDIHRKAESAMARRWASQYNLIELLNRKASRTGVFQLVNDDTE